MADVVAGYTGKQLRVNLKKRKAKIERINPAVLRKYLGGSGYSARILYDELKKGVDPLSPANKLVFTTGPLTLNRIPGGGSIMLSFKSPLTNAWGESRCGGDFGPDLKKAGFDAIIVEDRSDEPVYLVINDVKAIPIKVVSQIPFCYRHTDRV